MPDPCRYQFRDQTRCSEPALPGSGLCFWHDPDPKKTDPDIKKRLEEKHQKGERLEGFQLAGAHLEDIHLVKAGLRDANLARANLIRAHMFNIDLSGACLFKALVDRANLKMADLRGADLLGIHLGAAKLEHAILDKKNKVLNEIEGDRLRKKGDTEKAMVKYREAQEIYRKIKINFKSRGHAFDSGQFFYREMVMIRKQKPFYSLDRLWSKMADLSTGYGEMPQRIFSFSFFVVTICAALQAYLGMISPNGRLLRLSPDQSMEENLSVLYNAFYFSMTNFTTVGYGDILGMGVGKAVAVLEAFCGAFLIALFAITVYKRYMER